MRDILSINEINNDSSPETTFIDPIQLDGNTTLFREIVAVEINNEIVFSDVPVVLYLFNENIAILITSHQELEGLFNVPL